MKNRYNIFILPAGSGMAVAAIKTLKKEVGFRIVTADSDGLAPGLYLADKSYLLPKYDQSGFWRKVKKIAIKEKIDLIIPALDPWLLPFSEKRDEFKKLGSEVMVSNPEVIAITRDKWKTYLEMKDVIPVPKSSIDMKKNPVSFPVIIKPRDGSGSIGVCLVSSKKNFEFYLKNTNKPIIQEYLPGKEWSVDCLTDLDGNLLLVSPRLRIDTRAGISVKGKTVKNREIEQIAKRLTEKLKFRGIFFFQLKEDKNGTPKLTEINPRIAGTTSLSGVSSNIYSLAIRMMLGETITIPKIKKNLYLSRYYEELYLTDKDIRSLKKI